MKVEEVIRELDRNRKVFRALLTDISEELITWKADSKRWCLLEIVCHLVDEEREDFRTRVGHALEKPLEPLTPIDPVGWPKTRNYLEQDFETAVKKWEQERIASVKWLCELNDQNWESAVNNQELGKITARGFLFNWLAHDYLHIRQINALKHAYLKHKSGDSLTYAGNW